MRFFFVLLQTPFPNNWMVVYGARQQFVTTLNPSNYKAKVSSVSPPHQQLEILACVLRLRSVLRVTNMGTGICTQATEKARATESSMESFTGYREEGWELSWGVRQWDLWGFRTCRSGNTGERGQEWEGDVKSVSHNLRECLLPRASFISSRGRSANGCYRVFQPSCWRFPLPTPVSVVTGWPLKTREWDSPILTYPKRTILSARLMLGMKAFDYLAFLLISYNALGSFYKAIWLADINAETMRRSPSPFLWPCNAQSSISKPVRLPGFSCRQSSLRFFIVQTSKEPGRRGDKRLLLKAPWKRKYLFCHRAPTNVPLCSMAWGLRRWKRRGLHRAGGDPVR